MLQTNGRATTGSWFTLAFALGAAGCASATSVSDGGRDASSSDALLGDATALACTLPNGVRCPAGQSCAAGDGCNVCACGPMGEVRCTERACGDGGGFVDAVSPPDAGHCGPQDARGDGLCDGFFGYAWNGSTCASISGCSCVGTACPTLVRERAQCLELHGDCAVTASDGGMPSIDF